MKVEQFNRDTMMSMDSMHDSWATEIKIENGCLIIVYNKLNEGVLGSDGKPYYKNKKLTIKYELDSHCDGILFYGKNKYLWIDMLSNMNKFNKITKNCIFDSYKYYVDSFGGLTLQFFIRKIINEKHHKCKFYELKIELDIINITYTWE